MICAVYMVPAEDCDKITGGSCVSLGSAAVVYERLQFNVHLPTPADPPNSVTYGGVTYYGANSTECPTCNHGPKCGNAGGSYLTMVSIDGLMFGIINTVGNFGTVFVDQSYWQSAIAAHPASAHRGYMYGGLVWFTIPFALATSLGLASNALNVALVANDAGAGLVPPAAAFALLGPFGAWMILIMLFMAITSTGSAEMIAVSSLITYDVYRKYINPSASGAQILKVARIFVGVWAVVMFLVNIILQGIGNASGGAIGLGWVYNFMGIMIGSAVFPVSFLLLWDKTPAMGACAAAIGGNVMALIVWMVHAASICKSSCGSDAACVQDGITAGTLGTLGPQLSGNLTAILSSGLICLITSLVMPQNYNFDEMNKGLKLVEESVVLGTDKTTSSPEFLTHALNWIIKYGVGGTIGILVLWPIATVPWGVFSKPVYQLWSSVVVMWGLLAATYIIIAPLWENKSTIMAVITCSPKPAGGSDAKTTASA